MQFYVEKEAFALAKVFLRRLGRDLYCSMHPMTASFAPTPEHTAFAQAPHLTYRPIAVGKVWGKTWDTGYFALKGAFLPPPEALVEPICRLNFGGEALLYSAAGKALTSLTAYCWFAGDYVREIYYPDAATSAPGKEFTLYAAVSASKFVGMDVNYDPDFTQPDNGTYEARFTAAETGYMRTEVAALIDDLKCLLSLAETLPAGDYRRRNLARALDRAENVYADTPANAACARAELAPLLARPAYADALSVTAVGHAHLDTAYMWPIREGVQKCGRTFATQLELLERYPEYVFGASQPQHYAFTKANFPEIYARIRSAVAAGRWELQGGMWVEADTNIPDGEALVRQFLHGKNFFRDEFGIEVKNLWLPDVFGYSAALPQIMKLAGCENFVSIKLAWNDCNHFPYHTFRWCGIDGSEVVAHFPPEATYGSNLKPEALANAQNSYAESAETGEFLSLFGLGDGGAGACRDDMESGLRQKNLEGVPKLRFGAAQPVLQRFLACREKLPTWEGELYLELHRGTLTAIARMKRNNRQAEQLLPAIEFLCTAVGGEYPAAELDKAWKQLLLYQFHDIMAGSSIDATYLEAAQGHREIRAAASAIVERTKALLPAADGVTLMNSLNTPWQGNVTLPAEWGKFALQGAPTQLQQDGTVTAQVNLPPLSFTYFAKGAALAMPETAEATAPVLENDLIRYTFDADLGIVSAFDKVAMREVIPAGQRGNALRLYRDYPSNYEAWNLDKHTLERAPEIARNPSGKIEVRGTGAEKILAADLVVGASHIHQEVRLAATSRQLDFSTRVNWQETRKMLRVEFPTTLHREFGTYDIQFGALRRPTGENTSWDLARFEVAHQKYMDLSEVDYGAALLNDCKYGGRVWPNRLDLALLRSARFPAMHSENGLQEFRYAFVPHPGDVAAAHIAEAAEAFNRAPLALVERNGSKLAAPVAVNSTGVVLAACKKAEKSDDVIVRLVERYGQSCRVKLTLDSARFAQGAECDLMEWQPGENCAVNGVMDLEFRPFEIKTVRLRRK